MKAARDQPILFGPFCLDRAAARLLRDGRPIALTPKAFDLLHLLASKPGRLITKQELLQTIWADVLVSDASIKVCVSEVRKALDDGAKTPQYIETVHRRGYRFIGLGSTKSSELPAATTDKPIPAPSPIEAAAQRATAPALAGRDAEMKRLLDRFSRAAAGQRQCVLLTGSPGTGKTALIESFLESVNATILMGHCFEQFGTREPYLPVWEAIRTLTQQRRYAPLESLLARHAAALVAGSDDSATSTSDPLNSTLGAARRVLGEMADAIESLAADTPLVFVLEDVQWIDHSTLDLLTALARRRREARLLVIATFRPAEVQSGEENDPLREVVQELLTARLAEELPLGQIDQRAVADYLSRRFNGIALPKGFAHRLHERTDGHPLFLVHVVDDLVHAGVLAQQQRDHQWALAADTAAWQVVLETQVPASVRAMIDLQLQRLAPREQQVLEAAAVAGVECSAAAAAAAMGEDDIVAVERVCDDLARRHRFLAPAGVDEWPDGTLSSRYRFVHELYHNVITERLGVARRAQLHRALGLRLENAWGERTSEQSPALAVHFELGRDWPRAVRYFRSAGDAAARQYAHREAVEYFRRGVAALERLPASDAVRHDVELPMLMSLGANLRITQGCAAPGVEQVFARAEKLIRTSDAATDISKMFPLLWAVWVFHKVRSDLVQADELARRLLEMAAQANDPALLMQAHQSMCVTALCMGNPRLTVDHMRQAERIYDPTRHPTNTNTYGQDPGVATLALGAVALAILDENDEAVRRSEQAVALARQLDQPSTICFSLHFAAMLHQLRGDADRTETCAAESIALATEESFSFWRAGGLVLHGWATYDLEEIRAGLDAWTATGSRTYLAYYLGLQADTLIRLRRQPDALRCLDDALDLARRLPEGLFESPLHRLRAHCLAGDNAPAAIESRAAAIRIAQSQGAIAFQRRASADA